MKARDRDLGREGAVVASDRDHKPVLLHELLHAYHDQRLEAVFRNQDILNYFARAKASSAFAANSHMLQNVAEFFACTATTFLFGVTAQEPFQREKVKENQSEFLQYLKTVSVVGSVLQRAA